MNYYDFFVLAEDNIISLLLFSLGFVVLYLMLYRKYFLSVFDPMFTVFVASGLANAIVFYLYYLNQIRAYYFYSFIVTEIAFIAGYFVFKPIKDFDSFLKLNILQKDTKFYDLNFITVMFYWSSFFHVFSQLLTYYVVGLPIFMESRLTTYSGGSGFGLFGRLLDISSGMGMFLLFYRMFYTKTELSGKIYNYIYLVFIIFALIVSGNKTNLLFLIWYLFVLNIFMVKMRGNLITSQIKKIQKYQKIILFSAILLVFLVIAIQLSTNGIEANLSSSLLVLGRRIISFGDIYYLTLPNDLIVQLNDSKGAFLQLFKDPLGMFRIVPWTSLPQDNGFAVTSLHYGDLPSGPNPRYNYFAMLYFGTFGQVTYCFILGMFLSFLRNKLFYILPKNIFFGAIYAMLYFNIIYAFQDMPTMILKLTSIAFFVPIIFGFTYLTMKLMAKYEVNL